MLFRSARCGGGTAAGLQGFWQHQVLRDLAARAAGNIRDLSEKPIGLENGNLTGTEELMIS